MKVLTSEDVNPSVLQQLPISVIGYGAQGRAQALCLRDSGLDVTVGLRPTGSSWTQAKQDGFEPKTIDEAAQQATLIHLLLPDEVHRAVYTESIAPHLEPGKILSFSHGFSVVHGLIQAPQGVDVILVAPKSPGTEERKAYLDGFGAPGLIAVARDASGKAKERALALAYGLGLTRAGVLECSFEDEVHEDLFGEQAVLCGGTAELIKAGFETLLEAGYPPEMAYFECLHELKLIVDLIYQGGLSHMWDVVSNTAEYGGRLVGPSIIDEKVKKSMRLVLQDVRSGFFAKRWIEEFESGCQNLQKMRQQEAEHPIEVVGKQVRALFVRKNGETG